MGVDDQCAQLIEELGFTRIEAQVYVHLLQDSPATGYRIAKEIGRSFTNTYKALSTLETKGAVLAYAGKNRLFRAVPVEELFDQLEKALFESDKKAKKAKAPDAAELRRRFDELKKKLPAKHQGIFQPFFQKHLSRKLKDLS